ncbi:hypothetical protein AB6A40_001798 [Gnathostoma spinigerum]|uniref:Amino acid transporter transmembrane domain-containing protein n=1 Tax=Gnathostoma spinigerum TaxID=75299 RepID=A0ABD6E523_9BILA
MSLSCQTQLFCVADCIKDPSSGKVDTVVSGAVNICSGIYAAVGVFGYVAFHDKDIHGDILLFLNPSLITQLLKLAFMITVAVSIPLMLFPSRIACYNLFMKQSSSGFTRMSSAAFQILTITLLAIALFIAIFIPNVEFVLGLTGSLIGSLVTIIIPSLIFLEVCPPTKPYKLLLIYAKVCVLVGSLMLVCSTWTVLQMEQQSNVVDVVIPKKLGETRPEDSSSIPPNDNVLTNVPLTESLLNLSMSVNTMNEVSSRKNQVSTRTAGTSVPDDIRERKEKIGKEAKRMLAEMKEQRKQQDKMIIEQQRIVSELDKQQMLSEDSKRGNTKLVLGSAKQENRTPKNVREERAVDFPPNESEIQDVSLNHTVQLYEGRRTSFSNRRHTSVSDEGVNESSVV